eukprot:2655032-Alexandrium_andersonii.AAC.1
MRRRSVLRCRFSFWGLQRDEPDTKRLFGGGLRSHLRHSSWGHEGMSLLRSSLPLPTALSTSSPSAKER